jgi:hypothetical protein
MWKPVRSRLHIRRSRSECRWEADQISDLNPNDPGHREMLWRRFHNMRKKGCTLFYLDSFGDNL